MSSFDVWVKDKRSLIYEILFSLEGIVGDLVETDNTDSCSAPQTLQLNDLTLNSSISLCEINLIKELLQTANHYNGINHFVQKYSSDSNSYNRRLAQTVDELLVDYRNDLIEVEKDINRNSNYSLIKFNKFLKYSQTFEFLNEMVSQFAKESNCFVSVLDLVNQRSNSGFTRIQSSAKIIEKSSDCLYSDILSWILFGYLSKGSNDYFFIKERNDHQIDLDISRIPSFIHPSDAFKILKIGETVRRYQRNGVNIFADKSSQLFECLRHLKRRELVDKTSFAEFLESVRKIVSEHSWNHAFKEQSFRDHFSRIKDIYLTSSDNFWVCFVTQISKIQSNGHKYPQKEVEKALDSSLRQVFGEIIVNQILSEFSIDITSNGKKWPFFIRYQIPDSLQTVISEDSLDKYNEIMAFMAQLYSSRSQLNEIWIKIIKTNTRSSSKLGVKALALRLSLSFIINAFYNYFKTDVIERLFAEFLNRIEDIKDMEIIQKEHQILLTEIMGQMFLKTSVINHCLDQLFILCKQFGECLDSEEDINRLIEDLDRIKGQAYHLLVNIEAYKTNKMISNLVLEIEKSSKQILY